MQSYFYNVCESPSIACKSLLFITNRLPHQIDILIFDGSDKWQWKPAAHENGATWFQVCFAHSQFQMFASVSQSGQANKFYSFPGGHIIFVAF